MTIRQQARAIILLVLTAGNVSAFAEDVFRFVYLERENDSFYAPHRSYTGLTLKDRFRPIDGARTALREGRIIARMLNMQFKLKRRTLGAGEKPGDAVLTLHRDHNARFFLLDLPREDFAALKPLLSRNDLIFFNIRHRDDRLRGLECAAGLFHTIPSDSMTMDALAQFLARKNWRDVLILRAEHEADRIRSDAFQRAAHKFRLHIVDERNFVLNNDPRQRANNNVTLLTSGEDFDVVFLADSEGEFGRYVPFNVQKARPVIGSEGLATSAWHWTWERHGAPQLNQRFARIAKRRMQPIDYAAWAAVRTIIEAAARTQSTDVRILRKFLVSDKFTFDTYKGAPGNFRQWDNQLRQAILLHTSNAVIDRAPIDGFLHEHNTLDTLGTDRQESGCRM